MYLTGIISIDPAQATEIVKVRPTKGFGKLAHFLTAGMAKKSEEHETFTAFSILQQVNKGLRSIGVTNVLRLAKDDQTFYEDNQGRKDDLKEALTAFTSQTPTEQAEGFRWLALVLEHNESPLSYLIDIRINRTHDVGEYPLLIKINGLVNEFILQQQGSRKHREATSQLKKRMEKVFSSQQAYDEFVEKTQQAFDGFLRRIEEAIRASVGVDDVIRTSNVKIVRPRKRITSSKNTPRDNYHDDNVDPVYYGYYGYDDRFFYAWLWAEHCHDHDIYCHNVWVVDDQGDEVMHVSEEGFHAGESNALDPSEPFEPPQEGQVEFQTEHAYVAAAAESQRQSSDVSPSTSSSDDTETKSWWSGFSESVGSVFEGGGDSGDSGDSGGSCGGGCGGCGGGGD